MLHIYEPEDAFYASVLALFLDLSTPYLQIKLLCAIKKRLFEESYENIEQKGKGFFHDGF